MIIVSNDRHLKATNTNTLQCHVFSQYPIPKNTYTHTHTHRDHFLLPILPFQYAADASVCYQWGALSHNDRPLWKALLPGLSACLGQALSEMDVPLIELFHLLSRKHFKPPSPPLNHNPIYPIFHRIMHQSCLLPKSPLPFSRCSYFFTWHGMLEV